MSEVPIPFVEKDLDTDDGVPGVLMTLALLIGGFAVFAWARGVGDYLAGAVNSKVSDVIGVDPTSGEEAGADLV